jgi:PleD family two-component response regulator
VEKVGEALREKILIVQDTPLHHTATPDLLRRSGYATALIEQNSRSLDKVSEESPDLVIMDLSASNVQALELCTQLKSNRFTNHIPIAIVKTPVPSENRAYWIESGADFLLDYPFHPGELYARIKSLLRRSVEYQQVTHLPPSAYLHRQVDARLAKNVPMAVLYVDIDHFGTYNSAYGNEAGDRVLQYLAHLIVDMLPPGNLSVAHMGEDDFMMALPPSGTETFAQTLIERFRTAQCDFYGDSFGDGCFEEMDTLFPRHAWPPMNLSVALVSNERRALTNYVQVSSLLSRLMARVKAHGGDNWVCDHPEECALPPQRVQMVNVA